MGRILAKDRSLWNNHASITVAAIQKTKWDKSAPPIRRCQFGPANSALGQFGAGSARRRRFGAGTFRRIVSNRDIKIIKLNELKNYRNHMFAAIDVQD